MRFRTSLPCVLVLACMMLLGKDFDLASAPAATHAWTAREHYAVFFYRKLVQFSDRHLKSEAARP